MFWKQMFLGNPTNLNLLKFLNLVNHLGALKKNFQLWCDDIPAEYLKMQVDRLILILD